jgi:phosphoribosyl 1,2-cyclic phosphate phosphodiesterase
MGNIEFVFLGTSSWEQYPGIWCTCENCQKARDLGGKNIRTNACAWLAPDCLIDFPPQIVMQARQSNIDITKARFLLVTHSHDDHFCPHWLWGRKMAPKKSKDHNLSPRFSPLNFLKLYGNNAVCEKARKYIVPNPSEYAIEVNYAEPFKEYDMGELSFIPLLANHWDYEERGLNYIIERHGKKILYAVDTGLFLPETESEIMKHKFDLVVIEGTYGYGADAETHLNLKKVEEIYKLFKTQNLMKPNSSFCVSHISPHFTPIHDKIAPVMAKTHIIISYDGLRIKL